MQKVPSWSPRLPDISYQQNVTNLDFYKHTLPPIGNPNTTDMFDWQATPVGSDSTKMKADVNK